MRLASQGPVISLTRHTMSSLGKSRFVFRTVCSANVLSGATTASCTQVRPCWSSLQANITHGKGLRSAVQHTSIIMPCKACNIYESTKKKSHKRGHLPPKPALEIIPWHTLCVDLIGPCDCGKKDKNPPEKDTFIQLCCLTMIDSTTGVGWTFNSESYID